MTTRSDPQRRRTVIDLLHGVKEYVYPVGRLDYDTQGILLLTNDGDLAAKLTHPRHRSIAPTRRGFQGCLTDEAIERLHRGIPLDGRRTCRPTCCWSTKDAVIRMAYFASPSVKDAIGRCAGCSKPSAIQDSRYGEFVLGRSRTVGCDQEIGENSRMAK